MEIAAKRAIVTGGARGLGRAMVDLLLARGAEVSVVDLDGAALDELVSRLPGVGAVQCDLTHYDAVVAAVSGLVDRVGVPDILINNAGVLFSAPLVGLSPQGLTVHTKDDWDRVIASNLSTVFTMTSAVVPHMVTARKKGLIVNISSVSADGNAGQTAYSAAKAGVNAMTAVWAKELAPHGIRVVAVAPGFTETGSTHAAVSEALLKDIARRTPVRRLGRADEIAAGVIAIIENDFFSGKVFHLDGGLIV